MTGNPALRKLGFDAHDRVVVIHADDIGMCQATLPAVVDLIEGGLVSSASVMVPCPWFLQAAAWFREHPLADVGIHLTLTSEWEAYRWGPLSTRDPATGLPDEEGYFPRDVVSLLRQVDVRAARSEMQTQIDRARAGGLTLTHMDSHMFAVFNPRLISPYVELGVEHGALPFVVRPMPEEIDMDSLVRQWEEQGLPIFDQVHTMDLEPRAEDRVNQAKRVFDEMPPGLSCLLIHPAVDTPELRAITPDWPCRVADYEAFLSSELRDHVRHSGIQVIGYRPLLELMKTALRHQTLSSNQTTSRV
jgi:hypothetical protein